MRRADQIEEGATEFSLGVTIELMKFGTKEYLKDIVPEVIGEGIASLIPGFAGAYNAIKRRQVEDNFSFMIQELVKRLDVIQTNYNNKNNEQKKKLDQIYGFVMDYVIDEPQQEKIQFIINGFEKLTSYESISDDFVLTYYDLLKSLRLVDISTLKIFKLNYSNQQQGMTYQDVINKHMITHEQYNSVKENLLRYGLLTTQAEENNYSDIEKLYKSVGEIQSFLKKVVESKTRNPPSLKAIKLKTRENRYKITKLGREFLDFFVEENIQV